MLIRLTELRQEVTERLNIKRTQATIKLNQKFVRTDFKVSDKVLVRRSGIGTDKTWYPLNSCLVINAISQDGKTVQLMNESGLIVHTTQVCNIRFSTKTSKVFSSMKFNISFK